MIISFKKTIHLFLNLLIYLTKSKFFAKVIAWNIWQMDGIKYVIPNSCCTKEIIDEDLFERRIIAKPCVGCTKGDNRKHNGIYCIIKDWETHRNIRFVDMVFGGGK